MAIDREVSAAEMMTVVARAKLATGKASDPRNVISEIRQLTPWGLVHEFHASVATLDALGLLTRHEKDGLKVYAENYLSSPLASSVA